jgi:hypothetical protein
MTHMSHMSLVWGFLAIRVCLKKNPDLASWCVMRHGSVMRANRDD